MFWKRICTAIAGLMLLQAQPLLADEIEEAVAAPSRTAADRALDEGRRPVEILRFAGVESGDVVADYMAGGGYYSALIADLVGKDGSVYAVNAIRFHNPAEWEQRLATHDNIRIMPVPPKEMLLAPGSVDMIFAHMTFHDLYWVSEQFEFPRLDEQMVLANWHAAVKPGGHVIIVDHVGPDGDPRDVTGRLHRIAPETVIRVMAKAGFELVDRSDVLRRSEDDHSTNVYDASIRGKTDRFALKFQKAAS